MFQGELAKLAKLAGISAGVTLFVVNELGLIARVEGNSMQPTFNPYCGQASEDWRHRLIEKGFNNDSIRREIRTRMQQDRVLLNKWALRNRLDLRVGDVVILISPKNPNKIMIKRITAMPGDVIYIVETRETKVIEEGHCWVEGDNQQSSYDSNNFGPIPLGLIEGRVCCIVWPLHRIGPINCDPTIPQKSSRTISLSQRQKNSPSK